MNRIKKTALIACLLGLGAGHSVFASPMSQRGERTRTKAAATLEVPQEAGIAWFGTWTAGLAEAKRTGRPILLMSAAPQCHGVPGMW